MKIRSLIVASLLTVGGALAFAAPASAEPEGSLDDKKTLSVQVTEREDSGKGSPTIWAKDTFKRSLTITFEGEVAQDGDVAKTEVVTPPEIICADVIEKDLTWKYKMVGIDTGTFVTVSDSATGSPGDGAKLIKGAEGNFSGGFTATFEAPAYWCSFDKDTTAEQRAGASSSEYPKLLFSTVDKVEMPAWTWKYTRCTNAKYTQASAETWTNGIEGNTGDILGKPCDLKPAPTTPAATPTTGGTALPTLPLTGEGGGTNWTAVIAIVGSSILVVGTALVLMTRKRRFAA